MRTESIQTSLRWLTAMTKEISRRIKEKFKDITFKETIQSTLLPFQQFAQDSGKNANLDCQ